MSRVEGSITIAATPQEVQTALEDVSTAPEWTPSLEKVWDIQGKGTGCTYKWQFKLGPASFEGATKITESSSDRLVMDTTGGIPSTWIWTMSPFGSRTRLHVAIEYTVPGAALGAIANKLIIEKQNQKELDEALANLKARLEG